jgi:NAD(P)-dependent dehydrogenase (short-subunit alcohol dehydrogenase family)
MSHQTPNHQKLNHQQHSTMNTDDTNTTNFMEVAAFCSTHQDTYPAISPLLANLSGKSVVITGASKGIGRATALSFARAGCTKFALAARSDLSSLVDDIRAAARERNDGTDAADLTVLAVKADVTSEADVQNLASVVKDAFGVVDVLINNAGTTAPWVPLLESEPSAWWSDGFEVSVQGTYLCCRYLLPLVLASQTKTIINLSSLGAHLLVSGASSYQTSKFATCRLTEFLVAEYGNEGLVAVAIHPGGVATETGHRMPSHMHRFLLDTPELAADFMVWLARERREWLRGRYLHANWDVEELEAKRQDITDNNKLKFRLVL